MRKSFIFTNKKKKKSKKIEIRVLQSNFAVDILKLGLALNNTELYIERVRGTKEPHPI